VALFLSTVVNKVDRKGRVSVPAGMRAALSSQPFQGIVAFRSFRDPAIEGWSIDRLNRLADSLDEMELFSEGQEDLAAIFADAHQLPFDGEGRIILPEILARHAGITGDAAFVGRGATFQIWNPATFEAHAEKARERVKNQTTLPRLRRPQADGRGPDRSGDGA
jgi:MraZ protein